MVRLEIPNISLGTVYRNLAELVAEGEVIKIDAGDGMEHYDGYNKPHYHMFCRGCKSVSDIDMEYSVGMDVAAAKQSGAQIEYHNVVFMGICKKCK